MTILITGIHGFIGSNLSTALCNQHSIYGLDIIFPIKEEVICTFGWNEFEKIPPSDAIIHLAGMAHYTVNQSQIAKYFEINVGLTKIIFDHFLKSDAKKFIFFSSVKAVTDSVRNNILTEDDIPNPQTPYGQSKLSAENYILNQPLPPGKHIYILRPAMIHGPGNRGNLNLLYNLMSRGIPYPLGAFENQRSFTSIGNLNYIIEQFLEKDIPSGIYQVADSESLSTNEIITLIANVRGQKPKIWKVPVKLVKIVARLGDFFCFPFNSEKLKKLTENYLVSNKKITDAIGVTLPITARDGLLVTLTSFQSKEVDKL